MVKKDLFSTNIMHPEEKKNLRTGASSVRKYVKALFPHVKYTDRQGIKVCETHGRKEKKRGS